jgi:hypothetical protein
MRPISKYMLILEHAPNFCGSLPKTLAQKVHQGTYLGRLDLTTRKRERVVIISLSQALDLCGSPERSIIHVHRTSSFPVQGSLHIMYHLAKGLYRLATSKEGQFSCAVAFISPPTLILCGQISYLSYCCHLRI